MEHKSWIWRRRSSEKTISISDKLDLSSLGNKQEKKKALELEGSLKDLKEQLSSARTESNAKDDILAKQAKVAEEAIAGWERAEAEADTFKQELDEALLQNAASKERLDKKDAALKECMQQVQVLKEEYQHILNDAALKLSREQEHARMLEERLAETNKRLGELGVDNSNLCRLLEIKERLIDDLTESKSRLEAKFSAILGRLDSSEKDNSSLKYEVCMLQKELEIKNEDRDFNLKSADAAHRQHLESIKKITKLESECQRLRAMVRKKLPGPAAMAKMRSEVELLGHNATEARRKRSNSATDFVSQNGYDASTKAVSSITERLHAIEDENKILKEILSKKNSELQSSRIMFARTASKLSQAESQLEESSKGQNCLELARSSPVTYDLPLTSISEDGGNEDAISCAESWASALISELEHFRNGKPTTPSYRSSRISDLSFMDDFAEMERLAVVSVDKPSRSSHVTSGKIMTSVALKETESTPEPSESAGKELVPIDSLSDFNEPNHEVLSNFISFDKYPSWLQDILRVILQKHHITRRSLDVILEEVRVALGKLGYHSIEGNPTDALCASGSISQTTQHTSSDTLGGAFCRGMHPNETTNQLFQSNLEKSLRKLIELIEGIIQRSIMHNNSQLILSGKVGSTVPQQKSVSASPTEHVARVFLWDLSELNVILQRFIFVCNDLLHGKSQLEKFASELASTLEWIIDHCFSLQDVSTMKETIKKLCDQDDSHTDNEFEAGSISVGTEVDRTDTPEEVKFRTGRTLPLSTTSNSPHILSQMEEIESKLGEQNKILNYETTNLASRKKDLEERHGTASAKSGSLSTQLQESEESISSLQAELAKLKESRGSIEDQIEIQKLISEDLDTQLTVAKVELNESYEEKSNCCEELEATRLELQLQLESVAAKETLKNNMLEEEKQLRTDWEISAASEKLAECQATILKLGKELKALAAPEDATLFDKVMSSSPSAARTNRHPQLLESMRAEDNAKFDDLKSPKTKEIICTEPTQPLPPPTPGSPNAGLLNGQTLDTHRSANTLMESINQATPIKLSNNRKATDVQTLVLVPKRQKGGGSLLKKLLMRRKRREK